MRGLRGACLVGLAAYTIAVLSAERYSRSIILDLTAEITASGAHHSLNTSLCVLLLFGSALLHTVALRLSSPGSLRRRFLMSQVIIFVYLGCDDYFGFHEVLGMLVTINDAIFLVGVGVLELYLLLRLGDLRRTEIRVRSSLWAAGGLFGAMAIVDGNGFAVADRFLDFLHLPLLGIQQRIPYAVEDQLKVSGCAFLFLFSWDVCKQQIGRLQTMEAPRKLRPKTIYDHSPWQLSRGIQSTYRKALNYFPSQNDRF